AVRDREVRLDRGERLLVRTLVDQVLEAVFGVEAVDLAVRVTLRVVPEEDVDAVGEEDDRPNTGLFLPARRALARLLATDTRVLGSLLRLDHCERLAIIPIENVVGEASARLRRHRREPNLLANLRGVLAVLADVPAGGDQRLIDQAVARGLLAELEQ